MSIEYTIDLQLTELGFPDILLPDKSCEPPGPSPEPPTGNQKRAEAEAEQSAGTSGLSEESDAEVGAGSDSDISCDSSEADEAGGPDSCRCPVCKLLLSSLSVLRTHLAQYSGSHVSCRKCGLTFTQRSSYRVHLRTHTALQARFFCRICRTRFNSQQKLKAHLATTHLENKFYECDNCKHVFISLRACQKHVGKRTCVEDLHCKGCGQNFTSRAVYRLHCRTTCAHKCPDCQMIFSNKNNLLRHSFTHIGCPAYTCLSCNTRFSRANQYHAHKCKKDLIRCKACLREFANEADFQQHIHDTGCWGNQEVKDDAIRCLECGKAFQSVEELKQHASAHQKVLRCAECGKGFRSALLLMSHMGGHAGATPCLCQSCGLGFPHQQNFGSHLKTCGQELGSKSKKPQPSHESKVDPASISPTQLSEAASRRDGCWKLTLDKDPPPGTNLVIVLPVKMLPQNSGAPQDNPENPPQEDPEQKAPLDVSNSTDTAVPPIKSEPEESEISGSISTPPSGGDASRDSLPHVKDEPESPMDTETT